VIYVETARNFYGVVKVAHRYPDDPEESTLELLQSGVNQGEQMLAPEDRLEPACDFNADTGLGLALRFHARRRVQETAPLHIGVIGLGVGMIAAHGKPGDEIRYYEINPNVTRIAQTRFTFLKETRAKVDVIPGDGRLSLERENRHGSRPRFDVLVIDAFRGAAPPMHLMAREAFQVYLESLHPEGLLLVNFEHDTFDLSALHRGLSAEVRGAGGVVRDR
jgi:hypothetical protein